MRRSSENPVQRTLAMRKSRAIWSAAPVRHSPNSGSSPVGPSRDGGLQTGRERCFEPRDQIGRKERSVRRRRCHEGESPLTGMGQHGGETRKRTRRIIAPISHDRETESREAGRIAVGVEDELVDLRGQAADGVRHDCLCPPIRRRPSRAPSRDESPPARIAPRIGSARSRMKVGRAHRRWAVCSVWRIEPVPGVFTWSARHHRARKRRRATISLYRARACIPGDIAVATEKDVLAALAAVPGLDGRTPLPQSRRAGRASRSRTARSISR